MGCTGIVLLLLSAVLLLSLTLTQQGFLDRDQWVLIAPLVLFWCYL